MPGRSGSLDVLSVPSMVTVRDPTGLLLMGKILLLGKPVQVGRRTGVSWGYATGEDNGATGKGATFAPAAYPCMTRTSRPS